MFRTHPRRRPVRRRGAILLVVLVLLALFAVIGLSFVFYAESQATASRIGREAQAQILDPPPDSDVAVNEFLKQVLYPIHPFNPQTTPTLDPSIPQAGNAFNPNVRSALYGHDMARLVYGYRFADPKGNTIPYNGIGLFHEAVAGVTGLTDRAEVINHSFFKPGSPIFDPEQTGSRASPTDPILPTSVYVGKNAPYTYPDRNNVAVALVDPETGQVIIPSYHRPSLFGGLERTNPNWTSPAGRYKILRPRPADHMFDSGDSRGLVSDFPYPTPNADGTYTGDVQNLVYADGVQKKDSVWLDFNGPVYDWRGTRIKPLIAALVVPLDGRINLNAAGNVAAAGGNHSSNMGFGPWEQNPAKILINPANVAELIRIRHNTTFPAPSPRGSSVTARAFHPDPPDPLNPSIPRQTQPPEYARIDWNGFGATAPPFLPGLDPTLPPERKFGTSPTYPPPSPTDTGYNNSDPTTEQLYHPSLYTPYFRDPFKMSDNGGFPGTFPLFDMMRLAGRYSDKASNYSGYTYLGSKFVPEFAGVAPASGGPNDPLRLTRALTTAISNSLHRPGVAPNYLDATTNYQLPAGAPFPTLGATAPTLNLTTPPTGGATTDLLDPAKGVSNQRLLLSGVDLNRPLADYRTSRPANATDPWPLSPATVTQPQFNLAWTDRQNLAKDIFVRLIIATGAEASIDAATGYPIPGATATPGTPKYDALRWLAQLAVNIVDYIDNDDISTPFIWNPTAPANPLSLNPPVPNPDFDPAQLPNRVVFGVEKPRLVINEVYAEVANDPADKGAFKTSKDFQVRFFLELLNPNNAETNPQSALVGPDPANNPGAVPLRYTVAGRSPADISAYQIQVFDNAAQIETDLGPSAPQNVTGAAPGLPPKIVCDFVNAGDPTRNVVSAGPTASPEWVEPNNGYFAAATARQGFAVIGPQLDPAQADGVSFVPDTANAPFNLILQKPNDQGNPANLNQLIYTVPQVGDTEVPTTVTNLNANKHAVLLRRLACPYLPANDPTSSTYNPALPPNPYVTVDYMSRIQVHDAIAVAADKPRTSPPTAANNFSIGRVQPYAGYQNADPATATWQQTLTLKQQPNPALSTAQHSFFRHNAQTADPTTLVVPGDATLWTPFEWLTHLDRRLISQTELLHVSATKPHELTHRFATVVDPADTTATRPYFHMHDLRVPYGTTFPTKTPGGPLFPPATPTPVYSPLYRALAMLDVSPWGHGLPAGGRVPGRVNINMLWDENPTTGRSRVFDAVMDKQLANSFTDTGVNNDLTTIWNAIKKSRSPGWTTPTNPVVGNTYDEVGPGPTNDRPFKSFGSSLFGAGGNVLYPTDIADTILRNRPAADTDGVTRSLFSRGPDATNPPHPYQEYEPLRKAMNSFTTVSDTYIVIMTVGYFEVRNRPGPTGTYDETNPPILGKEVYDESPGDMRYKYSVVIDRTRLNLELAADGTVVQNTAFPNGGKQSAMWFSNLAVPPRPTSTAGVSYMRFVATGGDASTSTIQVHYEGTVHTVGVGTRLRIGTGANAQLVEVTAPGAGTVTDADGVTTYPAWFDANTGLATVTFVTPATLLPHVVGEAVSNNVVNGNPGPQQPQFDTSQPLSPYRSVVPRLDRVIASP